MLKSGDPVLTADGSRTRYSKQYGQTYHSEHGAETESRHVFLDASGVAARLRGDVTRSCLPACSGEVSMERPVAVEPGLCPDSYPVTVGPDWGSRAPAERSAHESPLLTSATQVLEIGFGLGLNCLLTVDMAHQHGTRLSYHAVENNVAVLSQMSDLQYDRLLKNPELYHRLMDALASLAEPPVMKKPFGPFTGNVWQANQPDNGATVSDTPMRNTKNVVERSTSDTAALYINRHSRQWQHTFSLTKDIELTLYFTDAQSLQLPPNTFHAVYLDAFSPDANPECWSPEFLQQLYTTTTLGGALTTYSAKGSVRRSLGAAGFLVERLPGPPGKRQMLRAVREC